MIIEEEGERRSDEEEGKKANLSQLEKKLKIHHKLVSLNK